MKPLFRKFPLNERIFPLIGARAASGGAEPPAARADGKFYTEVNGGLKLWVFTSTRRTAGRYRSGHTDTAIKYTRRGMNNFMPDWSAW